MKKIIVIGGSNSKYSINKEFALYTANQIKNIEVEVLDLNEFEMPLFSVDTEKETGVPELAIKFLERIGNSDGVILSLAEHNGSYTVAFKNILDWTSRACENIDIWRNKPMFLLSTSPGGRGGASVHKQAMSFFPHMSAQIKSTFTLPKYYDNYSSENGIVNQEMLIAFTNAVNKFETELMDKITL